MHAITTNNKVNIRKKDVGRFENSDSGQRVRKIIYRNKQLNGIVKKNNTSSKGRLYRFMPLRYVELKCHTPIFVKIISQTMKNKAVKDIPGSMRNQYLW
jgi:hypothetical protein